MTQQTVKVLALCGSLRTGSWNRKLLQVACAEAKSLGAQVTVIDAAEYQMPIYDGDQEAAQGMPAGALALRRQFQQHDALLIASPENNASVSAYLKNTLDWVSRPAPGEPPPGPYANKVAAILAASPGALGGLRGLVHLRQVLLTLGVLVLTEQFALSRADKAFQPDGSLADGKAHETVAAIVRRLIDVTGRLKG